MQERYREKHQERKNKVLRLLENSAAFFDQAEQSETAESLRSLAKDVASGTFSIVVVGEFSAGKSTFLNALMGDKYLPSFSTETTATVNFLKHKDLAYQGNEVAVHFTDSGKEIEHHPVANLETIEKLVSTRGTNVVKDIKYVEMYLDSPFLQDGVTLVDSPGLNGVAAGHRDVTEKQIEQSHASIFMFSSGKPGSKSDFEFLASLEKKVNTIIFVLNQIDLINESEQSVESVINKLKENYSISFPDKEIPEIWPLAGYPALVARCTQDLEYHHKSAHSPEEKSRYLEMSRIGDFETRLLKFLTEGEKTKQELLSPVARVGKLLTLRKENLTHSIEELSSTFDGDELKNQVAELQTEIARITEKVQNEHGHIKEELRTIEKDVKHKMDAMIIEQKDKLDFSALDKADEIVEFHATEIPKMESAYAGIANRMLRKFDEEVKELFAKHARENFDAIEKTLEDKIASSGIKLSLDSLIQPENYEFQVGLEQFDAKQKEFEQEIEKLREQQDQAEEASAQKTLLEKRIARIESQKRDANLSRENLHVMLGSRPDVKERIRHEDQYQVRDGVLGKILTIIIGKKKTSKDVIEKDATDRQKYDQKEAELSARYENEVASLKQQAEAYEKQFESLSMQESKLKRKDIVAQIQARERKLEESSEEMRKLIERKNRKAVASFQSDVQDHIKRLEELVENEFKKEISDKRKIYVNLLETALTSTSKNILNRYREELELKEQLLSSSVEEKTQKITSYNAAIAQIDALIENEYSEVKAELESMTADQIKLETL